MNMAKKLRFLKDVPGVAVAGEVKTFPDAVAEQWRGKGVAEVFVTEPVPQEADNGRTN
jgi:hypothetical protein